MNGEPRGGDPAGPAAARLRQLRARHGLSQEQLARVLGVSFATVNRWETGRTQMSARARQALADFEARDGQAPADAQAADAQPPPSTAPAPPAAAPPAPASPAPAPPASAPPAPSSPTPPPAGPPLPVAQSSFIGRDRELAELIGLLDRSRLLTLIGPGGAGKTRLAVEAISRRAPAGPVAFIPLEAVRQPESLITVLAAGLRVPDRPGVPRSTSGTPSPRWRASCSARPREYGSWLPAGWCSARRARCAGPCRRWSARPPPPG